MAVLSSQTGVLFLLRRPCANKPIEYTHYIPCIHCLGFVHTQQAYKHVATCPYKRSEFATIHKTRIVKQGRVLLNRMTATGESSVDWTESS